jgi:adenosine deaminase CECR1
MRCIAGSLLLVILACAPVKQTDPTSLVASSSGSELDQKLAAQWQRYESARDALVKRVVKEGGLIGRAEWEALLDVNGPEALTFDDLKALRERQAEAAATARAASAARSVISLDKVRDGNDVDEFCHELPKGGMLHIHPWGTLDRETVMQVLDMVNPKIDFKKLADSLDDPGGTGIVYPDEHQGLVGLALKYPQGALYKSLSSGEQRRVQDLFFLPPGNHDFDRFTGVFTAISALAFANPSVDAEPYAMEQFFKRAKEHNVSYIEISRTIVPKPAWIASLDQWAADVEANHGIVVRLHSAYNRTKDAAFTRSKAEQLLKLPQSPILTGINFVADESLHPALDKGQTLYVPVYAAFKAGETKLRRTMHAGELGDVRNVRDALIMGVDRVGHGVKLYEDPLALEYARKLGTGVEVNLMSNQRLSVAEDVDTHPFLHFLRLGLKVSLSTDDEGIFESTIDDECRLAVGGTDVTYDELKQMSFNAIETAFVDSATKSRLVNKLTQAFARFESRWQPEAGRSGGD